MQTKEAEKQAGFKTNLMLFKNMFALKQRNETCFF